MGKIRTFFRERYESFIEDPIKSAIRISIVLGMIFTGAYICKFFNAKFSSDPANWGVFGDYFGGILGALFNILSVFLIYLTFKRQEDYSHIERFETTFFNLLDNQRDIVKTLSGRIEVDNAGPKLKNGYEFIADFSYLIYIKIETIFDDTLDKESIQMDLSIKYISVYDDYTANLGHYFRHLYHLVKYTDDSLIEKKQKYIDIIQAQMTDDELYINFYNSISDLGCEKFLPLLGKYCFFENIRSMSEMFDKQAKMFYPDTVFKYKTA
jgi:hypothetical protein